MKKIRIIALVLSLVLLLQNTALPSLATHADEGGSIRETVAKNGAPLQVDSGSVSIVNGCRTIDGMVPLSGNERRLDSAQGVFLFDRNTKTVIYSYNPDMKISPGTLAKLVTALVVIEECDLDEMVVCHSKNISRLPGGTQNVKLKELEELTVKDLLYCLILAGANDAAVALTEHVSGNMASFTSLMNARVREMGCTSTEFGNVHGLDNANQFTTARDMCRIYMACYDNPTLREIMFTTKYKIAPTNRTEQERSLTCGNYLIDEINVAKYYDNRVDGGLASYSAASGASLVCSAKKNDLSLVLVVMGCNRIFAENGWLPTYYGNFDEMVELLEFAFNNFKSCRIMYEGQALYQLPVSGGECNVVAQPNINYDSVLPADCKMDNLIKNVTYEQLSVPIEKGARIGTITLSYRSTVVAEAELFAMAGVSPASGVSAQGNEEEERGFGAKFISVMVTICLIVLGLAAAYLTVNALRRAYGQARRRRRRQNRRRNW